jgi:hypothetical protein
MNLIYDVNEIKDFINKVLAPLEDDEVYILLLNTRKKYCKEELSRSEEVLGRELVRDNDIPKIIRKIRKIACTDGVYVDRNTLKPVHANCMVLYMLLDPRSTLKGYGEFISNVNKWIYESFKGESNLEFYRRIDTKLFSAIHKSRSRPLYRVIDIDKKDEGILDKVTSLLEGNIRHIMETHGGYHITVDKNNETGRIIYEKISGHMVDIEILDEPMNPLPGTLQGGFKVKGIRRELWK